MPYNIDPELAAVAALPSAQIAPLENLIAARMGFADMSAAINVSADVSRLVVQNNLIPGPEGAPQVAVRVYTPIRLGKATAGLLYIHGGGFVFGSVDGEHMSAAMLADKLGIVVVSVDYRLAPESPFPAGLEDCFAALQWLHNNAERLCVDPERIAVFGHSAGGGLSAALALLTRDRCGPRLCFQFLGTPELDDRLETASMRTFTDTPMWSRPHAIASWSYYLGDGYKAGAVDVPFYAAPARATDLTDLPPAYISAMEFDPLRDEGILYALKLMEAGTPVELHTFPGTFHGSMLAAGAAVSKRQEVEMLAVLERALAKK